MKKSNIKIIAITAIITTLLVGGLGVAAVTLTAKDIGFTSTNEGWEADNVEDAMNDLYVLGKNKKTGVVFTSSPVDMKQYTDRWSELTTADFKVGCTTAVGKALIRWGDADEGHSHTETASPSMSYDKSTGRLTFANASNQGHTYHVDVTTSTSGVFVVWLGTVGGK